MNYSITYSGVLILILANVAAWLGLNVGNEAITTTVLTALQFAGAAIAFFGRWRAGGVNIWGLKK